MPQFLEVDWDAPVPESYQEAKEGLRLRVVDATANPVPTGSVTAGIGDELFVSVTWGFLMVSADVARSWAVSDDELVATARANVAALEVQRSVQTVGETPVDIYTGHPWVSSLITTIGGGPPQGEGVLVVVPRFDVLAATPATDPECNDGLEMLEAIAEMLYDPDRGGISPHVWWRSADGYRRRSE